MYFSRMSYDNFRNGFWNPSTFGSGSQQRYSFYLKKVAIYFRRYFPSKFLAYSLKLAA